MILQMASIVDERKVVFSS